MLNTKEEKTYRGVTTERKDEEAQSTVKIGNVVLLPDVWRVYVGLAGCVSIDMSRSTHCHPSGLGIPDIRVLY